MSTRAALARLCVLATLIGLQASACGAATPTPDFPPRMVGVLDYGEPVSGALAEAETRWAFTGSAGDQIALEYRRTGPGADSAPPPLVLLGPGGDAVGRPVNTGGGVYRIALTLLEGGQYTVALGAGQGSYSLVLALERAADAPAATLPPSPTSAPPGQTLQIGQVVTGAFDGPEVFGLWTFEGTADQTLTVQMEAITPELEPVLRLLGPDGALLARDDNPGGANRAQIVGFALPASGPYTLQTWGKGFQGDYVLRLFEGVSPTETAPAPVTATPTLAPTPLPSPTPTLVVAAIFGQEIAPGETVQGEITRADTPDRYAVFAPAGSILSVGMFAAENSPLVPAFEVYAPDGSTLAEAAGAPGDPAPAALATGLTLPVTGAYILFAHGQPDAPLGNYGLSVGLGFALRLTGGNPAQVGQTYQGFLARRGDQERWLFDLPANLTFSAQATALDGTFAPAIEVIGPDGALLAATRDGVDSSLLPPLAAAQAGRYELRVSARDNEGAGRYLITTALVSVVPTATFVPASLDHVVTLRQGDTFEYTFDGVPGDVVSVEALAESPPDFDPIIALYGPSGRRIARVDDSGSTTNDAALQLALDDGIGRYRVQAYGYALMPGTFRLRVQLVTRP